MSYNIKLPKGLKVQLKTKEELLAEGARIETLNNEEILVMEKCEPTILNHMLKELGRIYTIKNVVSNRHVTFSESLYIWPFRIIKLGPVEKILYGETYE